MFDSLYDLHCQCDESLPIFTTIELLPDELLLQIFSYASVSDLFYSWLNLNWRFNAIIYGLSIKVFYTMPSRSQCNSDDILKSLCHFASQVVCLRIDQCFSSDVLKKINIIDYSNVHILKLCQLDATQLDIIQARNFPHLKHLSLAETENFSLEVLCQFKSLHSCELNSLNVNTKSSNLSSSIQSMFLHQCYPCDIPLLFRHFPQIIFLKVIIPLFERLVQTLKPTVDFVHPNMKSFDVYFFDFDSSTNETSYERYNFVTELLSSITFDKHIRYRCSLVNTKNFSFEQFQHTVLKLDFARFAFRLIWLHKYLPAPNIDCIRQIPLFNRLKIIHKNSNATICHKIWTNTSFSKY